MRAAMNSDHDREKDRERKRRAKLYESKDQ